ncbi:TPA: N-acetyltransferase family protein [Bacillus pseudomycoides]
MNNLKNIEVFKATYEDRETVINLIKMYMEFYEKPVHDKNSLDELVNTIIKNADLGLFYICTVNKDPVGFATLYTTFSTLSIGRAMILNDLFVIPNYRELGVGDMLFNTCKKYVQDNNYAYMEWVTAKDNIAAQNFYKKQKANKSDWIVYSI